VPKYYITIPNKKKNNRLSLDIIDLLIVQNTDKAIINFQIKNSIIRIIEIWENK